MAIHVLDGSGNVCNCMGVCSWNSVGLETVSWNERDIVLLACMWLITPWGIGIVEKA